MKKSRKKTAVLRRYTSLPALLQILQSRQITLLNPVQWHDRNDAYFINQFRKRKKLASVLALCFSEAGETYHHWRVFTHGSEGVCIEFKREEFLANFTKIPSVRKESVVYRSIIGLEGSRPTVDQLPFLKRLPYKDEKEFRLVYVDDDEETEAKGFDIDLSCIKRITLNPWMPEPLANAVKSAIHSIDGCKRIEVYQTTILDTKRWKLLAGPTP